MSATKSQTQNPYPRGMGVGSVPVLFTLRNVQPSIFAAPSQPSQLSTTAPALGTSLGLQPEQAASVSSNSAPTAPAKPSVATSAATATAKSSGPIKPGRISNQLHNSAIGLLLLVLLFLVLSNGKSTNSSPSKPDSLAQKSEPTNITNKVMDDASTDPRKSSDLAISLNDNPPFELGQGLDLGESSNTVASPTIDEAKPMPSMELLSSDRSKTASGEKAQNELSIGNDPSSYGQSQSVSKPPLLPSLLDPSNNQDKSATTSAVPNSYLISAKEPLKPNGANQLTQPSAGLGNTAQGNNGQGNNGQTFDGQQSYAAPSASNPSAAMQGGPVSGQLAETGIPMKTSDLISAYQRQGHDSRLLTAAPVGHSNYSPIQNQLNEPFFTPIGPSNMPQPVTNGLNYKNNNPTTANSGSNQLMTGQTYPPVSRDYQPMTIPAYERNAQMYTPVGPNAVSNNPVSGVGNPTNTSPTNPMSTSSNTTNAAGSNRYQGTLIQQPGSAPARPYIPYSSFAAPSSANPGQAGNPSQTGNSVGYPPSN
jgi:hypothetical protein